MREPTVSRTGVAYAVLACCGWGFAFVGPLMLGDWPALGVAAGRYIAYGLASTATLMLLARRDPARRRSWLAWRDASLLSLSGNLLYYALLSIAVRLAGYVMPTLIIGLLPVTVSLAGRLRAGHAITPRYGLALALILGGLWLAHAPDAATAARSAATARDYAVGVACAFASLALWTVYGVANSERLRAHPGIGGLEWSSLQGAAALPFALLLFAATPSLPRAAPDWMLFTGVCLILGLVTSWAANALWNQASTQLPAHLLGQLIVFETIAGIGYGALWSGALPSATVLAGAAILVAGVVVAIGEPR
ncbi:DMT family transporter [Hydrocarboniphaga sp.]|uniref:DMT family transporter n=1 Tax=Hydrocarboniphaga sp. TaxID=2033016 RepID=UPI003D0C560E